MITDDDIQILKEVFLTKEEFEEFRENFNKFKDNQSTILARILKNTEDNRIDRTVLSHHSTEHEDRLQAIESKLGIAAS